MNKGLLYVGASGFSYPSWRGGFWDPALAAAFCERVRALGDRAGPVRILLAQKRDDGWLDRLRRALDPELAYAFELRHASWEGVAGTLVGALESDSPFRYLRFREPPYDESALADLAGQIRQLLAQGTDVYAYFKHEEEPTAPAFAQRLRGLI